MADSIMTEYDDLLIEIKSQIKKVENAEEKSINPASIYKNFFKNIQDLMTDYKTILDCGDLPDEEELEKDITEKHYDGDDLIE